MRKVKFYSILSLIVFFSIGIHARAQKGTSKKYPSLFWEITGKNMKKPSYLFGTMHVSNKMVFHLSDSFYQAIRSCDAVALELNPEKWQGQMFRMQTAQLNLARFSTSNLSDYLNEQSFQLMKYEDNLKRALSEDPTVVNSLLYRSYQSQADFEENTYLDLYIYQTGRKMGKMAAGVEDYFETEKLVAEAYEDMAKEKNKKTIDTDGESMYNIQKKVQAAYRNGDLDLMDSLDRMTSTSAAFNEKFLYKRNEIQANSIDTILKKRSLFVSVGAAHLPGPRGVIELLRNMGYKLRPIYIQDRDADQKDQIDKMKVPVNFTEVLSDDGMVKMLAPGNLFAREDGGMNDSWQYADMNNGSYYMLTRVHHHAAIMGSSLKEVLFRVDSMLYENIPGKILKKTPITKNGYPGYDVVNKTRRGDIQRYNIVVTPFEVLVFKMSGNDNYVEGKEAETFFSSIQLKETNNNGWRKFEPLQGGFSINFPQQPAETFNKRTTDRVDRWEYESVDPKTGNAYMVWKKSVNNLSFIEEDTFDLALIEESFKRSELVDKQVSRQLGSLAGVPFLNMKYQLKNGQYTTVKAFIKGPHYYLLAATGKNKNDNFSSFFESFTFTDYKYSSPVLVSDTSLDVNVYSAVRLNIDTGLQSIVNKSRGLDLQSYGTDFFSYWPKTKNAVFKSDSTGEAIAVSVQTFPTYYYSDDSAKFWNARLEDKTTFKDMVTTLKQPVTLNDAVKGYRLVITDTGSSRQINLTYLLSGNRLYRFSALGDTSNSSSAFISTFFKTATPIPESSNASVFEKKIPLFFKDFYSKDSTARSRANKSLSSVYFGKDGISKLTEAINNLKYGDKDYFELKSKLITELGFIDDSCCVSNVVGILKNVYAKTADTSYFQNAVLTALERLKTKESFKVFKELVMEDPPVFENAFEYSTMFRLLTDTLELAKDLFPELLQLASVEDYKKRVNDLLRDLVDSGIVKSTDYENYFSKLYFDAKIQLKKMQSKDEKILEKQGKSDDDGEVVLRRPYNYGTERDNSSSIGSYAILLMPFYDKNATVSRFFEKLLQSKDQAVQMDAALLMLKNKKKVPDSVISSLASSDKYRAKLLAGLEKIKKTDLFPAKYSQEDVARSLLLNDRRLDKFAEAELVSKKYVEIREGKGYVYLFKYRKKKDDDWQMGICGLQPVNPKKVSATANLVRMTDRKLKADEPVMEQFEKQLKLLLYAKHKSGRLFFANNGFN